MNLISQIFNKNFYKILLVIAAIEILSFAGYLCYWLNAAIFILIVLTVIYLTWRKLEYGLIIFLGELFIGGKGYLFILNVFDFKLSIRIALFIVIFIIYLLKYLSVNNLKPHKRLLEIVAVLIGFIGLGMINGLIHKNGLLSVFLDANGYFIILLFPVFLEAFRGQKQAIWGLQVLFGSIIMSAIKALKVFYILSLNPFNLSYIVYKWVRDTGVGEMTLMSDNFYRIFFYSQIYAVVAVVLILLFISLIKNYRSREFVWLFITLTATTTSIVISFSRSFWLALILGLIGLLAYLIFGIKADYKQILRLIGIGFAAVIISLVLIAAPQITSLIGNRIADINGQSAASRWNLLPVIVAENLKHPLLGTGFGTELTYQSSDPRIKNAANPQGWYTTYSFEWGYLDTITEMGILGLISVLTFCGYILYSGYKNIKITNILHEQKVVTGGFLIGFLVLMAVHVFSPYLNHPLGLGYLMLTYSMNYAIMIHI